MTRSRETKIPSQPIDKSNPTVGVDSGEMTAAAKAGQAGYETARATALQDFRDQVHAKRINRGDRGPVDLSRDNVMKIEGKMFAKGAELGSGGMGEVRSVSDGQKKYAVKLTTIAGDRDASVPNSDSWVWRRLNYAYGEASSGLSLAHTEDVLVEDKVREVTSGQIMSEKERKEVKQGIKRKVVEEVLYKRIDTIFLKNEFIKTVIDMSGKNLVDSMQISRSFTDRYPEFNFLLADMDVAIGKVSEDLQAYKRTEDGSEEQIRRKGILRRKIAREFDVAMAGFYDEIINGQFSDDASEFKKAAHERVAGFEAAASDVKAAQGEDQIRKYQEYCKDYTHHLFKDYVQADEGRMRFAPSAPKTYAVQEYESVGTTEDVIKFTATQIIHDLESAIKLVDSGKIEVGNIKDPLIRTIYEIYQTKKVDMKTLRPSHIRKALFNFVEIKERLDRNLQYPKYKDNTFVQLLSKPTDRVFRDAMADAIEQYASDKKKFTQIAVLTENLTEVNKTREKGQVVVELKKIIEIGDKTPWFIKFSIASGVALALRKIHARGPGFAHRDLKPANTLVDSREPDEHNIRKVDFVDFGFSDSAKDNMHGKDKVMGTPYYMSPEAIKGGDYDFQKQDIYSLGIMLQQLFFGDKGLIINRKSTLRNNDVVQHVQKGKHKSLFEDKINTAEAVKNLDQDSYIRRLVILIDKMTGNIKFRPTIEDVCEELLAINASHEENGKISMQQPDQTSDSFKRMDADKQEYQENIALQLAA